MKMTRAQKNYRVHSKCIRIKNELRALWDYRAPQASRDFWLQMHLRALRSIERLAIKGTK